MDRFFVFRLNATINSPMLNLLEFIWWSDSKKLLQYMGCVKWKSAFEHAQNAQIQTILCIWAFALYIFILYCPMILLADSEGPDMGLRCPHIPRDTFSHDEAHMTWWEIRKVSLFFFLLKGMGSRKKKKKKKKKKKRKKKKTLSGDILCVVWTAW